MKAANVLVLLLITALTVMYFLYTDESGRNTHQLMLNITNDSVLTLLFCFLLAWGLTLIKLYRNVKSSDKLLPKKKVFIFHGILLTTFIALYALQQLLL